MAEANDVHKNYPTDYYPSIPGLNHGTYKTNSFRTSDLGFRDFEIGKPGIVTFQ